MYSLFIRPPAGAETNITHRVIRGGLGVVKHRIESSDFVAGNFSYDSMRIGLINDDGAFSVGGEYFPSGGGYTRIILRYLASNGITTVAFEGIVEEMAIQEDERRYTVKVEVLSLDAIINKTIVPAGLIRNGTTFRNAFLAILNRKPITDFINVNLSNLNLMYDDTIDNGEWFSRRDGKTAIDLLLIASGTYAYVDKNKNYIIRPRVLENKTPVKTFYAAHDMRRLSPIVLSTKQINSGINRVFNKVAVNEEVYTDDTSIDFYGLKDRGDITMPFITDPLKSFAIAENLILEFRYAKTEMQIDVLAEAVQNLEVGSVVKLDLKKLIYSPTKLPSLYGQGIYGQGLYNYEIGKFISRNIVWTIYDKMESPEKLTATLKLRRYGRDAGGDFVVEDIYGEALYGESRYSGAGLTYGEALYGGAFYQ